MNHHDRTCEHSYHTDGPCKIQESKCKLNILWIRCYWLDLASKHLLACLLPERFISRQIVYGEWQRTRNGINLGCICAFFQIPSYWPSPRSPEILLIWHIPPRAFAVKLLRWHPLSWKGTREICMSIQARNHRAVPISDRNKMNIFKSMKEN